jgi:hypothetical protein
MVTTKSKLQMEFNKEVTSASVWCMCVLAVLSNSRETQVIPTYKGPLQRSLQERSLDIGRLLKSINLIQSSLDYRANVEQFNHQCFERSAKKMVYS